MYQKKKLTLRGVASFNKGLWGLSPRNAGLCGLKFLRATSFAPLRAGGAVSAKVGCGVECTDGKTMSLQCRTKSFARLAKASLLVFRRSSLMCFPSLVICQTLSSFSIIVIILSLYHHYSIATLPILLFSRNFLLNIRLK